MYSDLAHSGLLIPYISSYMTQAQWKEFRQSHPHTPPTHTHTHTPPTHTTHSPRIPWWYDSEGLTWAWLVQWVEQSYPSHQSSGPGQRTSVSLSLPPLVQPRPVHPVWVGGWGVEIVSVCVWAWVWCVCVCVCVGIVRVIYGISILVTTIEYNEARIVKLFSILKLFKLLQAGYNRPTLI